MERGGLGEVLWEFMVDAGRQDRRPYTSALGHVSRSSLGGGSERRRVQHEVAGGELVEAVDDEHDRIPGGHRQLDL